MFRSLLTLAALVSLFAAQSVSVAAQKPSRAASTKPASTAVVNLNTASAAELEGLPGIGAKTAARIVEYRQKNGQHS